jgi:hypothetical protein
MEQHGHIVASANRGNAEEGSYTITLFEYGKDGTVGFTWNQSNTPEELLAGREEVTEFQQYTVLIEGESKGRVIPWADIAGDFSAFLNAYDGIEIGLAGE